ncbi:MAG: flagellar M-ring protein FliF C-terminal domain-containing protein [Fimbriimonadaceae bacterium]
MGALLLKLRTWWETADRTQRAVTLFGGTFLVFLLVGTYYFASRPKMVMIYGGLTNAEAGTIQGEIRKMNIPVDSDAQGNVFVPSAMVNEVQSKLELAGKGPSSGHLGNEELGKFNAFMPPSVEAERLKAMLEGELARTIESIDGIASARVHITLGDKTPFAQDKKPASASVMVHEKAGMGIGAGQARAIALLVSRGTTGLTPENVFVVDSAGRSLYDGTENSSLTTKANEKVTTETAEAQRRERDLQAAFDASFGSGSTLVKVNLVMDFDKQTQSSVKISPKAKPVFEEKSSETMPTPSANAAAAPANANTNPQQTAKDGKYEGIKQRSEFATDTVKTDTVKAVGSISQMSIAVLVNSDKIKDSAPVQAFLKTYTAANPGSTAVVTEAKFDTTAATEAKKAADAVGASNKMQQVFSLLPIGALLLVGFMVLKGLAKTAKSQTVRVQALSDGSLVQQQSSLPQSIGGGSEVLMSLDEGDVLSEQTIAELKERVNLPLEQLKKMATNRPDSVALLIKSWMLEEAR